jgi:hypothetical protein
MNERIKELAEQSLPEFYLTNCPSALEKFAELIVRECVELAADAEQSKGGMPAKYHVLDHFGVEE